MAIHNKLGKLGEDLACNYLIASGYTILERNWHHQKAEVDILAQKDNIVAVIEVKTRSDDYILSPKESVTRKKIKLLVNAVDFYIQSNQMDVEVRFDIIGIINSGNNYSIEHLEDAFYHF